MYIQEHLITSLERFLALEKLTNYEIKELQKREYSSDDERRHRAMGAKQWEGRGGETTFPVTGEGAGASRSHEGSDLFGFYCFVVIAFF